MSVSIVVQRFRKCRLLIDELKYVTVGGGGDVSGCGLLAYVSFASTATPSHVEQAARTLLNLPILTTGLWGDDGSSTMSVIALAAEPTSSASLVVVPQANMISKVKKDGKSIQYHGQIDKEKGRELYEYFCECLGDTLLEAQCSARSHELPRWYTERRAYLQQINQNKPPPTCEPDRLFRDETKYSEWDERGFPIKDADGQDLTKSQLKKLNKIHQAHCKRYEKMKEGHENNETLNGSDEKSTIPPPSRWADSLDPSFCHFLAGSFGKRQGLELHSDMGPFVHSFQV